MSITTVIDVEDLLLQLRIRRWLTDFYEIQILDDIEAEHIELMIMDHIPSSIANDSEWILICDMLDQSMLQNAFLFSAFDVIIGFEESFRFQKCIGEFLRWKKKIKRVSYLDQEAIDQIRNQRTGWIMNIESEYEGFDPLLFSSICVCLQEGTDRWWSIGELALLVNASKTTLRKYLDELERRKIVQFRMRYGKGRPSREYTIKRTASWEKNCSRE